MSDPTTRALAAYRRLNPDPPAGGPTGCHVDLSGVPEHVRPGLLLAIREMVARWVIPAADGARGRGGPGRDPQPKVGARGP